MEESIISSVFLPLAIFVIMVAMGMSLVSDDFRRVLAQPRQVAIGLLCQLVLLPLVGFAVATVFSLSTVYAISIVLLAAAPGGSTSNVIVHAADGDRALSVTLTALSNSIVWLTMPFLLSIAFARFGGAAQTIAFPVVDTMIQIAALTIVPVIIGMFIRNRNPEFAERTQDKSKTLATGFLFLVIIALVVQNWATILSEGPRFAPAFIVMNFVALAVGYLVARAANIDGVQATTIAIETGIQNGTIAITIAISVLGNNEMAVIPGLYSIWMLITGFALARWYAGRRMLAAAPAS